MYFEKNEELPIGIKNALSEQAQTVYRETFNRNYPSDRDQIRPNSEEIAHQAAWRAVREFSNKDESLET